MKKTQFVVNSDPRFISKEAEEYILLNQTMLTDENRDMLNDRYSILQCSNIDDVQYDIKKEYVQSLSERVVAHYSDIINRKYDLDFSPKEWNYYIGLWIRSILFDAYERYHRLKTLQDNTVFIVSSDMESVLANSALQNIANTYARDYQMLLWARLFELMGGEVRTIPQATDCKTEKPRKLKNFVYYWNRIRWYLQDVERIKGRAAARKKSITGKTKVLVTESRMPKAMEEEIVRLCGGGVEFAEAWYFESKQSLATCSKDCEGRRKWICGFDARDEFERYIDELLIAFMPITFFEAVPQIIQIAREETDRWFFEKIYHSSHGSELFAMCCVLMKERDRVEIIDIQHGSLYGISKYMIYDEIEVWDKFITWGWDTTWINSDKVYAVGMNRISQKPLIPKAQKKCRILMAVGTPELNYSGAGWTHERYLEEQRRFIDHLTDNERKQLTIRARTKDANMSDDFIRWCQREYPMIQYEYQEDISFPDSLANCSFLVVDYYSTTHIDALMLGIPFTMFEGAKIISYNPAIKTYLSRFSELGVYKMSGKDLAEEIVAHQDYKAWLYGEEIQKIYKEYLCTFTRADQDLSKLWARELYLEA